jgi:hypothetical protein
MDRLGEIERKAMNLVRSAGKYGAHLTHLGVEVTGAADWIESQVPRVRQKLVAVARAVMTELRRGRGATRTSASIRSVQRDREPS